MRTHDQIQAELLRLNDLRGQVIAADAEFADENAGFVEALRIVLAEHLTPEQVRIRFAGSDFAIQAIAEIAAEWMEGGAYEGDLYT